MTITTTIYNIAGEPFRFTFEYEQEMYSADYKFHLITVKTPMFLDESFGDGWQDDLVKALHEELEFDFELKIV